MKSETPSSRKARLDAVTQLILGLPINDRGKRRRAKMVAFTVGFLSSTYAILKQIVVYGLIQALLILMLSEAFSIAITLWTKHRLTLFSKTFWQVFAFCYFTNLIFMGRWRQLTILELAFGAHKPGKPLDGYADHPSRIAGRALAQAKSVPELQSAALSLWLVPFMTVAYLIGIGILLVLTVSVFLWSADKALDGFMIASGGRSLGAVLLKNIEYVGDIVLLNAFSAFEIRLSDTAFSPRLAVRIYIFAVYSLHIVNMLGFVKEYLQNPQSDELKQFQRSLAAQFVAQTAKTDPEGAQEMHSSRGEGKAESKRHD
jgi:hypothetical protein